MKLAVFGGTGQTGQHIVRKALEAGHEVTALARTPSKFGDLTSKGNLQVIEGGVQDANCVEDVIRGADAVISALAPPSNKPEFIISKGTDHMLNAMQKHNVPRIIVSAGAGVRDPNDKPKFVDKFFGFLLGIISKNVVADMEQVVEKIRKSDRQWTVVRAPMLTNEPAKGHLKVGYVGEIDPRLSREDMAAFMLEQLEDDTWVNKAPAISN